MALTLSCTQSVPEAAQFANADAGATAKPDTDTDTAASLDTATDAVSCSPPSCDDADPCTIDTCKAGSCSHAKAAEGTLCGAFKVCTGGACAANCGKGFVTATIDDSKGPSKVCVAEYPVWGIGPLKPNGLKDQGDGTVVDALTGLQWQQQAALQPMSWDEALAYCNKSLVLAGKADWRLPGLAELDSLIDFGRAAPAVDPKAFPGTVADRHWSAMSTFGSPLESWGVDFGLGFLSSELQSNPRPVRCVRGQVAAPSSAKRFEVNAQAGTVLDAATKLTWQRSLDTSGGDDGKGGHNWLHAQPYCANLTLAGGGWRLPNIRELRSLIDAGVEQPTIDHAAFPATPVQAVWSLTPSAKVPTEFWYVHFLEGFSDVEDVATVYGVRCVR